MKFNKAEIFKWWHYLGIAVTGAGIAASKLLPLVSANPKAAEIVAGVGAASLTATGLMSAVANNKFIKAIINDPSSPTPTSFALPLPDLTNTSPAVAAAIADGLPDRAAALAAGSNAVDFARQLADSAAAKSTQA